MRSSSSSQCRSTVSRWPEPRRARCARSGYWRAPGPRFELAAELDRLVESLFIAALAVADAVVAEVVEVGFDHLDGEVGEPEGLVGVVEEEVGGDVVEEVEGGVAAERMPWMKA